MAMRMRKNERYAYEHRFDRSQAEIERDERIYATAKRMMDFEQAFGIQNGWTIDDYIRNVIDCHLVA